MQNSQRHIPMTLCLCKSIIQVKTNPPIPSSTRSSSHKSEYQHNL